ALSSDWRATPESEAPPACLANTDGAPPTVALCRQYAAPSSFFRRMPAVHLLNFSGPAAFLGFYFERFTHRSRSEALLRRSRNRLRGIAASIMSSPISRGSV